MSRSEGSEAEQDDDLGTRTPTAERQQGYGPHSVTEQHSSVQPGHPPRPILDAFFLPRGLLGRIGGVLMARGLPQQREIADLLATPGADLCEVGSGPGVLGALLAERHRQLRLHLVDPSPIMRSQAAHRCRQWQSAGRVDISAGTADQLPLPDAACDTVVATNTVVMWPDLAAGLDEIKRVLRPDGRLVLSWHSATAPSSTSRRLALSEDVIRTLSDALHATFGDVQRHELTYSVAWQAQRQE
ncbi:MAG: class I SAM-dependent methyltransferase [Actinomycetota bacterium]|jgi:SAM-dependent methyltransferase|nr:class I SAM-dependent methyltransferase [Actinomycetota bacterium]